MGEGQEEEVKKEREELGRGYLSPLEEYCIKGSTPVVNATTVDVDKILTQAEAQGRLSQEEKEKLLTPVIIQEQGEGVLRDVREKRLISVMNSFILASPQVPAVDAVVIPSPVSGKGMTKPEWKVSFNIGGRPVKDPNSVELNPGLSSWFVLHPSEVAGGSRALSFKL